VAGVVIELPPLATRREDVMPLAEHFAALQHKRLEPGVEDVLLGYTWPGNIRELQMVIERAAELVENGTLPASALSQAIVLGQPCQARLARRQGSRSSQYLTREEVLAVLMRSEWDVKRAAAELRVGRTTFFKQLKVLDISLRAQRQFTSSREVTELC
jgi:transcriptional regulator of acetoin/glycerol metabolism